MTIQKLTFRALHDFVADEEDELALLAGDVIDVGTVHPGSPSFS